MNNKDDRLQRNVSEDHPNINFFLNKRRCSNGLKIDEILEWKE